MLYVLHRKGKAGKGHYEKSRKLEGILGHCVGVTCVI
jgi:hypothetical protein